MKKINKELNLENIGEELTEVLEEQTGKKIFTFRVLGQSNDNELETVAIFENREVLHLFITVEPIEGKAGMRMRGKYI